MSCPQCVPCGDCNGRGYYWELLGTIYWQHPPDDLAERVTCDECGGSGVDTLCGECIDEYEAQREEEDQDEWS